MKIALVQLDADDALWRTAAIPTVLALSKAADLVVFPECMPFYKVGKQAPSIKQACQLLTQYTHKHSAFIAGGYVVEDEALRNAAFLVYQGKIYGQYFKRIVWQDEPIVVGSSAVRFEWGAHKACIPLICADAAENPTPVGTCMMYEAIQLGANSDTPIVVPSYSAGLTQAMWREALYFWSTGCGAPVAICGISGQSRVTYQDGDVRKHYGGGGSAVFWPDGSRTRQSSKRGIYIVDTTTGISEYRRLP
ncbi:hypothetical protein A1353_08410 [Methylomonas methanica]|uniref:CN hydrolase domain-containing protein n=1 Tax=Methylomonas methanica TaxID=421 RepID=A0A177MNK7_METMH|nr:carbon-nitrogen hydrolase family protein [Methylomonas methanica]OAI07035.1 hypothetical protein A1353_08410 [Methylomonas methanica]